jgi:NodT family efflux transporter outer membrane factor (OMF) lipoprotein
MRTFPLSATAASLLAACAVGPDFHRPAAPATETYTPDTQPQTTAAAAGEAGDAQRFVSGSELPGRWWESFQCPALNALVEDSLAHSPTAGQARARLRQAEDDLAAQSGATLYPSVDAQLSATRQRFNPAAVGFTSLPPTPPFNLYNAQVNVSYTLDLFGANRRMLENMRAQTEYQYYETQAAQLTLAANVVAAAIRQADLEAQVAYTQRIIAAQSRQLAISEQRYEAGGIALEDLDSQRIQLEQSRATLPQLQAQRRQVDHQLAVYTGKPPAAAAIPRFSLADLRLPTDVPLTLPSELVQRRPDVRASQALWHEASANVGVATANLFPHLTISGFAASERATPSQVVDGTNVWSVGATLLQPIFHGGELRAKRRSAAAAYDAAAEAYEETVLESLQQVADSLRILEADALALDSRSLAAEHASAGYTIAQGRFDAGGISESSLLDAERQQLQTGLDRSHAEAQRLADTAALMHALNGPL